MEVRTEVPSYSTPYPGGSSSAQQPQYNSGPPNSSPFAPQIGGAGDDFAPMAPPPGPGGAGGQGYGGGGGGGGAGLSADAILSDLDGAEMKAYQEAFLSFAGGAPVPLDNSQMREFLMNNGAFDDIEIELLNVMNQDMQLEMGAMLQLLQSHSISDGDAIGQFNMLSADGQTLAAEECRTGLTMMSIDKFNVNFPEDRMDSILNMVMMDAGPSVPLEQWMGYAKMVARYIRLFVYCGL